MQRLPAFAFLIVALWACQPAPKIADAYTFQLPATFDSLPPVPTENQLTEARIALGKKLFFDARLSADGKLSCGSCHLPALAYADTFAISAGVHGRLDVRNAPSLLNVAYQQTLFREGGIPNLELQVLAPFVNEGEMNLNIRDLARILVADSFYPMAALEAYAEQISPLIMAKALACFQRSLISSGSAYDAFMQGDSTAMTSAALRGMQLFYSDQTACGTCHSGFLFSDQQFYNVGLYSLYSDEGRGRLTGNPDDVGRMKTPSLRNVAITFPYMHDGSVVSLGAVLQHFNTGGKDHPNKDGRIRPLNLSQMELSDLKAFLYALTDTVYMPTQLSLHGYESTEAPQSEGNNREN
jgi:cytochrome c peroxidase